METATAECDNDAPFTTQMRAGFDASEPSQGAAMLSGNTPDLNSCHRQDDDEGENTHTTRYKMITKKSIMGALLLSLALPFSAATALAQTQPSSKVTAKTAALTLLPETTATGEWHTILSNKIKTANQKDLMVGVSLEVGLYTQTLARSKNMEKDSSTADGLVQVQVLVDGKALEPGSVVFGRRSQTLSATLEGAIASCLTIVTNPDGTQSIVLDPECVTPEEIELILETMDAATFNFVGVDIPQGVHTVSVQARIDLAGSSQQGSYEAKATVGKGSMTVESVRLIKDEDVVVDVP